MTTGRFIYIFRNMNIRSFADAAGIDYERLMDEFCGDTKALSTSIRSYLDTCDLPSLVKSVEDGDEEAVRHAAHRIRKCAEKLLLDETASLAASWRKPRPSACTASSHRLRRSSQDSRLRLSSEMWYHLT